MARKIILKENGLAGSGTAPSGYKFLGDSSGDISEKIGATVSAIGGGSSATTTVVNISSAQILAMGTTPIELLPAPGVGKYYDIEKIILEFTYGTSIYNHPYTSIIRIISYETIWCYISSLLNFAGDSINTLMRQPLPVNPDQSAYPSLFNQYQTGVFLTTDDNFNPTDGDGTLRAIITYTVRTFGA